MLRLLSVSALSLALVGPLAAQSTSRVSVDSAATQANGSSLYPAMSGDGRFVVFESTASNLVAGDTNAVEDVFVRDQLLGQTRRVSLDSAGNQGNGDSFGAQISDDGARVVFSSLAGNLVANDTNSAQDVFLHDLATGQTTRLSLAAGGSQLPNSSRDAAISADGRFAAFVTSGVVLSGDTNGLEDVFVVELATGVVRCASVRSNGATGSGTSRRPSLSADGRYVAFSSEAPDLVAGDTNAASDIFVRDLVAGTTVRASVDSSGAEGLGDSFMPALSRDGHCVAFHSIAPTLVAGDTNGSFDVFVRDLVAASTERASVDSLGAQSNGDTLFPSLSADGRYVAFEAFATNLVLGDTNGVKDICVHDRVGGTTLRASLSNGSLQGSANSERAVLSADGRLVAFDSDAINLVTSDTNGATDIFTRFVPSAFEGFCSGDGSQSTACPCANFGFPGNGCDNSAGTGGANLVASGAPLPDSIVLSANGELPSSLSIFLQGDAELNPGTWFGDGVRCVGGALKRLYSKNAVNGSVSAPGAGDLGIRARSAQLGDTIPIGATRSYQVYYRDPDANFCTPPFGNTWNVTNGVRVLW